MNEKIKELMLQVGFAGYGEESGFYNIPVPAFDSRMERFAELIVKECIKVAVKGANIEQNSRTKSLKSYGQLNAALNIKQHFGVEE